MATLAGTAVTLLEWAKTLDPNGQVAKIIEILNQQNAILTDIPFKEGNLPTGERTTIRTGLPTVTWRLLNQAVATSKGSTAQVDEAVGMLEAWLEIDKDIVKLNGNSSAFVMSQAMPFFEAMNQEMSSTLFYGNSGTAPEEFLGLAPRYSSTSAANGQNIISAGGSGADNSSVWLIGWGENSCFGIFPKGSQAGLMHEDLGEVTIQGTTGIAGTRLRAYQYHWQWKAGLCLKDWRFAVRIPNIDLSDLLTLGTTQATTAATFLPKLMARAIDRLPSLGMIRPVFYANRTVMSNLRVAAMEKASSVLAIQPGLNQFGQNIQNDLTVLGVPVRICDSLLENEAVVS